MALPFSDTQPVRVLWTGGWDSTFQLLVLLLEDRQPVQPVYMIDEDRHSLRQELLAMRQIKRALRDRFPHTQPLLLPTEHHAIHDIHLPPGVTEAFHLLRDKYRIGSQYEWLAAFCINQGVRDLQLCVHRDDRAYGVIAAIAQNNDNPAGREDSPERLIFNHFQFPILESTKRDMARIAHERGWQDLMEMTWFCHMPLDGQPCGQCNPCKYTIEEGLGHRIPAHRRPRTGYRALLDRGVQRLARFSQRVTNRLRRAIPIG